MKNTVILFFIFLFLSCNETKRKTVVSEETIKKNSNINPHDSIRAQSDTLKKEKSSVKIISSTLMKNQYSDHKDIKIVFKNSGRKTIKAIKFEWFCLNSFDEPASGRFFYGEGRFTANSVHVIKPGQSKSEFLEDFSTDANKIITTRAYYIVYTDGSKWILHDEDI